SLVSKAHFQKIIAAVDVAKSEGGHILCGAKRVSLPERYSQGYFYENTLIEGLGHLTQTNQNEIIGPIATLQEFSTEEEALELANATPYGLSASVWNQNFDRAHRMSLKLQCAMVWINTWMQRDLRTPFGGIKNSGLGR